MSAGGMVSLGKLTTSEFGVMPITETAIYPPTRNPWNIEHNAGGSSGGSGAAVAANLIPIAQGSDGGGSIRIPSSFCHLYGFKPSLSLLGNMHGKFNPFGMSVMGPLATTVEDSATMMDIMMGNPTKDNRPCWDSTQRNPKPMLIHMQLESSVSSVHPEIHKLTEETGKALEEMGHHVELIEVEKQTVEEFLPIWQYIIAQLPIYRDAFVQPVTAWLKNEGKRYQFEYCLNLQNEFCARIESAFGKADLLLSPTVGHPAPMIGQFTDPNPQKMFTNAAPIGAFTVPFNLNKGPAATLPLGLTSKGLPIGIQLGSKPGRDFDIFCISAQLEKALPWKGRQNSFQYTHNHS